jgi:hypothetical protein
VVDQWLNETTWGQHFLKYGDPFAAEQPGLLSKLRPAVAGG